MSQSQKDALSDKNNSLFLWFKSDRRVELAAAGALLCIFLLFRIQAIFNLNRYYLGSVQGDAGLYVWLLKTNLYDLFSKGWFEKSAFYPYSDVLAWSDNFILPSFVAKLLYFTGLSDPAVFNLIIFTAGFLNGYGVFLLCFRLSGEHFASFFSGAAFMTLPYFSHQLGHPQLQFFFFVPFGLRAFIDYLNSPSFKKAMLCGLHVFASFLTTVSYSIFLCLILIVFALLLKSLRPERARVSLVKQALPAAVFYLIILTPFVLPYLSVQKTFGERQIYEAYYFSANIFSYFSSTPHNLLYAASSIFSKSEAHLFPGLTLGILSAVALFRLMESSRIKKHTTLFFFFLAIAISLSLVRDLRPLASIIFWACLVYSFYIVFLLGKIERSLNVQVMTARGIIALFLAMAFVFFCISFGPLGNPEKGQAAIAPYTLFYTLMPGFSSIRAISRAGVIVLFCLTVVSCVSLAVLFKKQAFRGAAFLAFIFCLIENYNLSYPLSALPPAPQNIQTLKDINEPGALAILPFAGTLDSNDEVASWSEYAQLNVTAMLWSADISRDLLNGYSGQKTKIMRSFPRELKNFPSQRALNALGSIANLRYVLFAPLFLADFNAAEFESKMRTFGEQLKLIGAGPESYLFEINPERKGSEIKYLLPSAYSSKEFQIMLRTPFKTEAAKLPVIFSMDESKPFFELPLIPDGTWQAARFKLPALKKEVRFHNLILKTQGDETVIARSIRPAPQN